MRAHVKAAAALWLGAAAACAAPATAQEETAGATGLVDKGGPPPGCSKVYLIGERMPAELVGDRRRRLADPDQYCLRTPPPGYRWILYEGDAYLVRSGTGMVSHVVRAPVGWPAAAPVNPALGGAASSP